MRWPIRPTKGAKRDHAIQFHGHIELKMIAMQTFSNPRLRTRILLGNAFLVLLFAVLAIWVNAIVDGVQSNQMSDQIASSKLDHLRLTHLAASDMSRATRGHLLSGEQRYATDFAAAEREFYQMADALHGEERDAKQLQVLEDMIDRGVEMAAITKLLITLGEEGKESIALEQFRTGEIPALFQELVTYMNEMQGAQRKILDASLGRTADSLLFLKRGIWSGTLLLALLALGIGLWIANRISRPISGSVNRVSTASTEIAATVDEHERVVTQQSAAVNETTSTVEELGISARQSAAQAESMAGAAKLSLDATQEGIVLANQVAASMAGMKQKVGSVAEQILRLSEQAGQIGGIAKVVGELAGETNMLALNAAVEAARAGEHGKGFAVVAAEIRKLADQSKKSAERTNALVAEIQKATNSAVMVTEEGTRTADDVAAIIEKAHAAFETISTTANGLSVSAQQVLLNSKQQAAALNQVTEAMKSLAAGSRQMAAGTEQTKKGVQKLNGVALDLKSMV